MSAIAPHCLGSVPGPSPAHSTPWSRFVFDEPLKRSGQEGNTDAQLHIMSTCICVCVTSTISAHSYHLIPVSGGVSYCIQIDGS